jgi:hypothetical protein
MKEFEEFVVYLLLSAIFSMFAWIIFGNLGFAISTIILTIWCVIQMKCD